MKIIDERLIETNKKELLLLELKKFYDENKRNPTAKEFKRKNGYPSSEQYINRFGTWNNALKMASLQPDTYTNEFLINKLKEFHNKYGKSPSETDFVNKKDYPDYPCFMTYVKRFGSWDSALKAANLSLNLPIRGKSLTDEFLISELRRYYDENKRQPKVEDMHKKNGYPDHTTYTNRFGSWIEVLKLAGFDKIVREDKYPKEFLISELKRFHNENGRSPIHYEMCNENGYPHNSTFIKMFGSWLAALKEADLEKKPKELIKKEKIIKIDEDILRFIGYWLAEGDVYIDKINKNNGNQIRLSLNINDSFINDVKEIIKNKINKNVYESYYKDYPKTMALRFRDEGIANYLISTFGKGASTKIIPIKFLGLKEEHSINLLKGIILGDGTESEIVTSLNTTSKSMAQFVYLALLKLNFHPSLVKVENQKEKYGSYGNSTQYRISIMSSTELDMLRDMTESTTPIKQTDYTYDIYYNDNDYIYMPIRSIEKIDYKGEVYNLEVDESETYCAPMITLHNCENWFISNSNRYSEKWAEFRWLCTKNNLLAFKDFYKLYKEGTLPNEIEEWIYNHRNDNENAGDSEVREMYKLYYEILHPNKLAVRAKVITPAITPTETKVIIPITNGTAAGTYPEFKVTTTLTLPEEKEPLFITEKLECTECHKDNVVLYSCYIDPDFPTIMCADCWKVLVKTINQILEEKK